MGILDWITESAKKQYAKGEPYRQALGGLLQGDMNKVNQSLAKSDLTPTDVAMSFAPLGITAWHGSPYKFDKFDVSKIGSGEGAQAYGHGLYFAENPAVASSYMPSFEYKEAQNYLFNKNIDDAIKSASKDLDSMIKGKSPASSIQNQNQILSILLNKKRGNSELNRYFSPAASQNLENAFDEGGIAKVNKTLEKMKATEYIPQVNKYFNEIAGNQSLYKVDIADEAIPKMLDWDKPIGKQPKTIQQAIQNTKSMLPSSALDDLGGDLSLLYGKDITPNQFLNTWESLTGSTGSGEKALSKQGIPGIRYLDQGSRGVGKGTSNYVVFDPNIVKILERNGLLLP